MRRVLLVIALLVGFACSWQQLRQFDSADTIRLLIPLLIAGVVTTFAGTDTTDRVLGLLNDRSPLRRRLFAGGILLVSLGYFVGSAIRCKRAFHPTWHDDQMHAVQAQMLAKGYLWHAPHPLPEFFDTFHIFVEPVYAPIHFPGTAILNVAGVWLGLNTSVIPLLLMSLAVMLVYLVVSEVVDGASGFVAALFVTGSDSVRMLATMGMSHNAMTFLGPLLLWLFLRWRSRPNILWAATLGLATALAGVTRPIDALAYALPIGAAVVWELYRRRPRRAWLHVAVMVATGLPLVAVQLAFDKAVTGKYFYAPYAAYNDRYFPNINYGGSAGLGQTIPHTSDLFQKQLYYEDFLLPLARDYTTHSPLNRLWYQRLPALFGSTLPGPLLTLMVPLGALGLWNTRRWLAASPPWLMLALYVPHVFYLFHYSPVVITGTAMLAVLGVGECVRRLQPVWRGAAAYLWLSVFGTALLAQTPFTLYGGKEVSSQNRLVSNFVADVLPRRVETPALVFCLIDSPTFNYHDEPVYNTSTAWPDDAKIVLAQSFGPHNIDLVRYYSKLGQNRHVYDLSRSTFALRSFGTVDAIVQADDRRNLAATQPATRPQEK